MAVQTLINEQIKINIITHSNKNNISLIPSQYHVRAETPAAYLEHDESTQVYQKLEVPSSARPSS